MTKLLCKVCGNDKFQLLNENEALCKCGLRLTNLGEDHSKIGKERFNLDYKRQASVITEVILLKRSIDEPIDKRDKEGFYKLSSKLKVYQQYFQTKMNNL